MRGRLTALVACLVVTLGVTAVAALWGPAEVRAGLRGQGAGTPDGRAAQVARGPHGLVVLLAAANLMICGIVAGHLRWWLTRSLDPMTAELRNRVSELAAKAAHLAASSRELPGSAAPSAPLQAGGVPLEAIVSEVRRSGDAAGAANAMTSETEAHLRSVEVLLADMLVSIDAAMASRDRLSSVVRTIDEVAFHAHIAATNAAVEAARAGAAGTGFAAVADEFRVLAQRTAQAASQAAALMDESAARSAEGHRSGAAVTQAIASASASLATTKGHMDAVVLGVRAHTAALERAARTVAAMEQVTHAGAQAAEGRAAAAEGLRAQSEATLQLATRLSALLCGTDRRLDERSTRPVRGDGEGAAPVVKPRLVARRTSQEDSQQGRTGTFGRS